MLIQEHFLYWNIFTRTSLSCSKFPFDAKLMGKPKVPWALCSLSGVYRSGCVRAAVGFAFCWSVRSGQYHASGYKQT